MNAPQPSVAGVMLCDSNVLGFDRAQGVVSYYCLDSKGLTAISPKKRLKSTRLRNLVSWMETPESNVTLGDILWSHDPHDNCRESCADLKIHILLDDGQL